MSFSASAIIIIIAYRSMCPRLTFVTGKVLIVATIVLFALTLYTHADNLGNHAQQKIMQYYKTYPITITWAVYSTVSSPTMSMMHLYYIVLEALANLITANLYT